MTTTIATPRPTVGTPVDRVDGRLKVTGQAEYAADTPMQHVAFAAIVSSTIGRGKITKIDDSETLAVAGVLRVYTHANAPRLKQPKLDFMKGVVPSTTFMPLQTSDIVHYGQAVAIVVAESLESARTGAARVRIEYRPEAPHVAIDHSGAEHTRPDSFFGSPIQLERGDAGAALATAEVRIEERYSTPPEFHNAIEPHATLAYWEAGKLTVHSPSQWVIGVRNFLAAVFELEDDDVHVISPFVGGGFGSKGFSMPHTVFAAMAARDLNRPVKLVLSRSQVFTQTAYRSQTQQRLRIGARRDGTLIAIEHASTVGESAAGWFIEPPGLVTAILYACPNVRISHEGVRLNLPPPGPMRAPGETPGTFGLECALDELAVSLEMDPIELRVRNDTQRDQDSNLPFSSRHLVECLRTGAERFGWKERPAKPRARRDGDELIGWGVATATYPGMRSSAGARVFRQNGKYVVEVATHDIGTGMYSIMAQVAADALQVPISQIECRLGDSSFPNAPVAGGSQSTASVMPAVQAACVKLRENGGDFAEATTSPGDEENRYSFHSFGAQFIEVRVDEALGRVRVSRALGVFDCGKILNPKTARSQILGGVVMGIGMALMEEGTFDPRTGRVLTDNLADYRVPVNADIGAIDVAFVEEPDYIFNPLGARGIGEIGITGVAAAVANAVYHATGKRMRHLPITPDKFVLD